MYPAYEITAGTDDDLPPSRHNRVSRGGRVSGKGMPALSSFPYSRVHDMEAQIHHLEQEAYCSVLRAFKAQADAITWVCPSFSNSPNIYFIYIYHLF